MFNNKNDERDFIIIKINFNLQKIRNSTFYFHLKFKLLQFNIRF